MLVEGRAELTAGEHNFGKPGGRMNVFERIPPHCIYVPDSSRWSATATTAMTLAVCSALDKISHKAAFIGPSGISLEERGANTAISSISRWKAAMSPTACW